MPHPVALDYSSRLVVRHCILAKLFAPVSGCDLRLFAIVACGDTVEATSVPFIFLDSYRHREWQLHKLLRAPQTRQPKNKTHRTVSGSVADIRHRSNPCHSSIYATLVVNG